MEQAGSKGKRSEKDLVESEEKYKLITETSQTGIYIHQDNIIMYANDRFAQLHGYSVEELIGTDYFNLFHPDERARALEIKSKRMRGDEDAPQYHEMKRVKKDGGILWCQTVAVRIQYQGKPAIMGNIVDITERKQAEEQRDNFILELQDALAKVQSLSAISQTLNRTLDLDQVLNDALEKTLEILKVDAGMIRLLDETTRELVLRAHKGLSRWQVELIKIRRKFGEGLSWQVAEEGKPRIRDMRKIRASFDKGRPKSSSKPLIFSEKAGFQISVNIPLTSKGRIVGTMTVFQKVPRKFLSREMDLFSGIGNLIGIAIENAGLYRQTRQTVEELTAAQKERERLIADLRKALAEVKTLSGLLPICSHCKKIRDDKGYWDQIEGYIHKHSEAEFSHGICPECAEKYYPEYFQPED